MGLARIAKLTQWLTANLTVTKFAFWWWHRVIVWRNSPSCSRSFYRVDRFESSTCLWCCGYQSVTLWQTKNFFLRYKKLVVTLSTLTTVNSAQMKGIEDRWFSRSWSQMTLPGQAGVDINKIRIIMFESRMFDTCIDLALLSADQ